MSFKVKSKTIGKKSITSTGRTDIANKTILEELQNTWSYLISAYEYDIYYKDEITNFNGQATRINAIKMLKDFFSKYNISYSDTYNLRIGNTEFQGVLDNYKLWMMYIITMNKKLNIENIIEIFKNALANKVDHILLFEFFLIYTSKEDDDDLFDALEKCQIPEEFVQIYNNNKEILLALINKKSIILFKTENPV